MRSNVIYFIKLFVTSLLLIDNLLYDFNNLHFPRFRAISTTQVDSKKGDKFL